MKILLATHDEALARTVEEAVTRLGHELQRWSPSERPAPDAHIALFDGLEELVFVEKLNSYTCVLADPSDITLFAECPRDITDFQLKPLHTAEFEGRIRALCARRPWKEQMHRDLLGQAVDSASDIFELTGPDATYEYVNPAFEKILGHRSADAVGKTGAALIRSGRHDQDFFRSIEKKLGAGEAWRGVIVSCAASGKLVHLESTIAPVANSKGEITHHVAVKRDITDRLTKENALKESNRALEQARDVAVAASRAKSEFLANMSHELRTPLNAVIGYSELLAEDLHDNEQAVGDLARIRSAGKHLLELINDVLNISKIEADKIELFPELFDIAELLEAVGETIEPLASQNRNKLSIECSSEVTTIFADKTRVQQVLLNLLSNACKFTEAGSVQLLVDLAKHQGSTALRFQVKDTGIGISETQRERLFRPFSQADSSTTRKYGGTGLGLVISQRFVEMMQGTIHFDSTLGAGTTFTVIMPLKSTAERSTRRTSRPHMAVPLILIIDDTPGELDEFSQSLGKRGFEVCSAPSGVEGIRIASRMQPDIILLDVNMPDMSGWEVLSTLKLEEQTANIPVIMMSVLDQQDIGRALGAADYLLKPIESSTLAKVVERHTKRAGSQILVVEDDEATRELMCRTLIGAGHRVLEAENGQVALDILQEASPDLIVLDLMMPVMDGFTFLHHIQEDKRHAHIPTIVATARSLSETERQELHAVTERVIQKGSYPREKLLDTICEQAKSLIAGRNR